MGKPNAGKSSFVNKVLGENRLIVSPVAGTTRDSIDTVVKYNDESFLIIDTAGMRKRGKVEEDIERYSVIRALSSIDRADVCMLMIDASEGVTEQDTKLPDISTKTARHALLRLTNGFNRKNTKP